MTKQVLAVVVGISVAFLGNSAVARVYPVTVNYDQSIEEMVKAGKYDRKNSGIISKHFSIDRGGVSKVEIKLIQFSRTLTSREVFDELFEMGFRFANLSELLAFGAAYPDVQREFEILALGSVWKSWRNKGDIAYLGISEGKRALNLYWFGGKWSAGMYFAAVRLKYKKGGL